MRVSRAPLVVVVLAAAPGCGAGATGTDGGPRDAGARSDVADAAADARADAPPIDAQADGGSDGGSTCPSSAGGPRTLRVVSTAHLVEAKPFVDVEATIPAGCWSSIQVELTASSDCTGTPPSGQNWPARCDPFDRLAQVSLADPGTTPMFVLDAVTSFGGTATWTQDVTDYASLMVGKHIYHLEIDTYSDASGIQTGTASSHDATLTIHLVPGRPPRDVVLAVPLLREDVIGGGDAGTPSLSAKLKAPRGATGARLDYFTSGHGANGGFACDEFCPKVNHVSLDGMDVYAKAPTSDCSTNCTHVPIAGTISCAGTSYDYICEQNPDACPPSATAPRANWCPSRIISPIAIPLPDTALMGTHAVGDTIAGIDGTWSIGLSAVFYR